MPTSVIVSTITALKPPCVRKVLTSRRLTAHLLLYLRSFALFFACFPCFAFSASHLLSYLPHGVWNLVFFFFGYCFFACLYVNKSPRFNFAPCPSLLIFSKPDKHVFTCLTILPKHSIKIPRLIR